ncbi:NAD(P)/FAD-dependent oxidoreductase [Ornithinimicrobium sp. F0845]|uniref:NAD(P)/FAD-dependent oxidoreductase n=1 Tax=Ornithinimicrobium sp. F0845 TaxID=2926412 RepID=UPI001FF3D684|nr:NAD(P)/FAD-dependent oxidoreductase [Ornithinimicrobium sp. F0845]MCK0111355.1 NAD(P)/FAD-dependent oxidoreductase [Ornithinimicrobium sp. F0845]
MSISPAPRTTTGHRPAPVDVVIIGGGPAGLQAALTLGRMHRQVLLLDSGDYRNAAAGHLHNFVTLDGVPPAEFRARARADLAVYETVTIRSGRVTRIEGTVGQWSVRTEDEYVVHAAAIVLATGLRDTLPSTPGLASLWGDVVAHCPYCHGHEFAGQPVGLLGVGPSTLHLVDLMTPIASSLVVLADGETPEEEVLERLRTRGVEVRREAVTGVSPGRLGAEVSLEQGGSVEVGGLFVTTSLSQSAPFAEDLGLTVLPSGCIEVDEFGRTSRVGVYAAGDLAHRASLPMPMASVLGAASAGQVTAAGLNVDLATGALATITPATGRRAG